MNKTRQILFAATLTAVGLLFNAGDASAEKMLRLALSQDIRGTNPGVDRDSSTDQVHMHVVEGLVAYAEDFSIKPMLAESFSISEDGLTYTFKLRKGVKFHNGAEMTSADVVWSWERFMNPETKWRCRRYFGNEDEAHVVSMKALDDYTVEYKLSSPLATFLGHLARFDCGNTAVLHKDSVNADGSWKEPVGTGPYMIKEVKPGQYVELVKFSDYVSRTDPQDGYAGKKEALIDRIRYQILPDSTVYKTAFLAGDLDLIVVSPDDVKEVEASGNADVQTAASGIWDAILLNVRDELLKDKRIRHAMVHAVDRDQVVAVTTEGRGKSDPSPVPPSSSYFSDVLWSKLDYDPAKAKALLAEAGYDGQPIKLITNKRSGNYFERALVVQSMMKKVGLNVQLEVMEWGTQLDAYKTGKYQMQSFAYSARLDPALSFEMITGDNARKVFRTEKAKSLVQEALTISDVKKRQELINELHRHFTDEAPAIGLGHRTYFYGTKKNVSGFKGWGAGTIILWGVDIKS